MNIERAQTDVEKDLSSGGFKNVKHWRQSDLKQFGCQKIAEISQRIIYKERKPFCFKCAHKAVDERIKEIGLEVKERASRGEYNQKIELGINFEDFAHPKKFMPVVDNEVEEVREPMLIGGLKQTAITGVNKNFICKDCKGKFQLYFTNIELDEAKLKQDGKPQKS